MATVQRGQAGFDQPESQAPGTTVGPVKDQAGQAATDHLVAPPRGLKIAAFVMERLMLTKLWRKLGVGVMRAYESANKKN